MAEVFHVITDIGIGGAGIFLSHLLNDPTKKTGSLVLLPEESLLCSYLSALGIRCAPIPALGERSFSMRSTAALTAFLKEYPPALLVSHASLSSRMAAKRLGISTLAVRHCDTAVRSLGVPLYNALTDVTVATSAAAAIRLRCAGVKNVLMIENGVRSMGVPTEKERVAAKERFGFPTDRTVIGLSGRLAPIKGHETAIRALAALGKDASLFLLAFLGEGEEKEHLMRLSAALGVGNLVRFLGFSEDVRSFYYAIDVHLSCSHGSETSSLALAEGLSAGCPTLASDIPGNRARVEAGGLFFPPGDVSSLSRLFSLVRCKRERARLGAMAALRARCLPSWEETRKSYAALFDVFCGELLTNGCFFRKDMLY